MNCNQAAESSCQESEEEFQMKKRVRKNWLISVCIIAGIVLRLNGIGSMAAEMSSDQRIEDELVILVDVSESIKGYMDEIKRWAKKVGVYGRDTGITIAIYTFEGELGDPAIFQGMLGGKEEELNDYKTRIENNINWVKNGITDQLKVISTVIDQMNGTNPDQEISGYKYIVMLSDGILDQDNKSGINSDEEKAIERFPEVVKEFASKKKQGVALVGFGNHTSMFENIDGVLDYKVSNSEQNFSKENEFIRKIYENMGVLIGDVTVTDTAPNPATEGYKRVQFTLTKEYYKTLVNIECDGMTDDMANGFVIREEEKGEAIKPDMVSVLEGSCFLHYSYLDAKTYYIDIPENARCNCEKINEVIVSHISVSIEEDGKGAKEEGGVYCLQADSKECKIKITMIPRSPEQEEKLRNLEVKYYIAEIEGNTGENQENAAEIEGDMGGNPKFATEIEGDTGENQKTAAEIEGDTKGIKEYNGQGDWSKNIYYDTLPKQDLEVGKIYECWVTARQGNRTEESDRVMIKVEANGDATVSPSPKPDNHDGDVDKEDNDCLIKRWWVAFIDLLMGR